MIAVASLSPNASLPAISESLAVQGASENERPRIHTQ
jgi:hypothetical protein